MTVKLPRGVASLATGVLALPLFGASPGPAERRAYLPLPPPEPVPFARVVVQTPFDARDYQGTDPSGRFAFFSQVVIDLTRPLARS